MSADSSLLGSDLQLPKRFVDLIRDDFEIRLFRNALGSISVVLTKDEDKSVCFMSNDGATMTDIHGVPL